MRSFEIKRFKTNKRYTERENDLLIRIMQSRMTSVIMVIVFLLAMFTSIILCDGRNIVITDGAINRCVFTSSKTPDKIIEQAGIQPLSNDDALQVCELSAVTSSFKIERTHSVVLSVYGKDISVETGFSTVAELLKANGITVGENDVVTPELDSFVDSDCTVRIDSVNYEQCTEYEAIPFSTVYIESDSMAIGHSRVTCDGENGTAENTYNVKYLNGVQSERTLVNSTVLQNAKEKTVIVGTAVLNEEAAVSRYDSGVLNTVSALSPKEEILLDESGRPIKYKEVMTGTASAYTATSGKHTSTGKIAQTGYVAIDPKIIPYGTKMFIRTSDGSYIYGYAEAADTGGFTKWGTRIVDLYFPSEEECSRFGLRNVEIYILD